MRRAVLILTGLVILAVANGAILMRERQLADGVRVVLELAPVDPRSLMQGDYMALAYALERQIGQPAQDGRIIVRPDARGVAQFVRIDDERPVGDGEVPINYRVRDGRVRIGTNAWFFPEGQAQRYATARYGEFRADGKGAVLLVALLDERLAQLGAK